jgi:hypothetical protein
LLVGDDRGDQGLSLVELDGIYVDIVSLFQPAVDRDDRGGKDLGLFGRVVGSLLDDLGQVAEDERRRFCSSSS